ncbi:hypothetical protein BDZ89DRAFT_1036526 [Hymenopellis radicata]|nr:hypothetical protein BDZ89DRAFT_1036526 [Hymenopellis radicata]
MKFLGKLFSASSLSFFLSLSLGRRQRQTRSKRVFSPYAAFLPSQVIKTHAEVGALVLKRLAELEQHQDAPNDDVYASTKESPSLPPLPPSSPAAPLSASIPCVPPDASALPPSPLTPDLPPAETSGKAYMP